MRACSLFLAAVPAFLAAAPALAEDTISVQVLSATVKDKKIEGAQLFFQKNGENSVAVKTDAAGAARAPKPFGGADDASVLLIIKKEGYSTLVAKCPCSGMTYAISPTMTQLDGLRIVLNWGDSPRDLDSHLVYAGNHIYFNHKDGTDARLDVDDTDGYGPETITIDRKAQGQKYIYAVHNYSDKTLSNSSSLGSSRAKVFVYVGETLIRTYYVPRGSPGTLWTIFEIGEGGDFTDINSMTYAPTEDVVGQRLDEMISAGAVAAAPAASADAKTQAQELNRKGETAYHAKKLDESIALYQQALDLDPEYGQAYSNLGLAFAKVSRVAEAIWANRKAIALASGPTAGQVKASSYYNIARIYEDQKKWADAKQNYEWALQNKPNDAYTKGIARMAEKLKAP
jgi:tetratricopeptide (TPR) repeat protein